MEDAPEAEGCQHVRELRHVMEGSELNTNGHAGVAPCGCGICVREVSERLRVRASDGSRAARAAEHQTRTRDHETQSVKSVQE